MAFVISKNRKLTSEHINMKRKLILPFVFSFLSLPIIYSATIRGNIKDPNQKPVAYVNVVCYNCADSAFASSCITDTLGGFALDEISVGDYYIKCTMLGYSPIKIDSIKVSSSENSQQLEPLVMKADVTELNEFVVLAKSDNAGGLDKSVYKVSEKLGEITQTGVDVLKYIPSVEVSLMQDISVNGNTNIQYLIDGRKVTDEDVKEIDSRKIAKVEVVHNPSSKYDADISAVINIVLKKNLNSGFSGRVSTSSHFSDKTISNNKISLDYNYKNIRFFADGTYNKFIIDIDEKTENINDNGDAYSKAGTMHYDNTYTKINTGFNWKINNNNTLFYNFQFKPTHGPKSDGDYGTDYFTTTGDDTYLKSYEENNTLKKSYTNYLYYKHSFKNPQQELSLTSDYTRSFSDVTNKYVNSYFESDRTTVLSPSQSRTYFTENNREKFSSSLDYTQPIVKGVGLETGYNLYMLKFRNSFNDSEEFDYDESRHAGYANLNVDIKKSIYLQTGLRYEFSDINLNDTTNSQYKSWLPQFTLKYKINKKQNIKFSYRRSIKRPKMDNLNPFLIEIDSLNISQGNPGFKPSYEDKYELSYTWLFRTSLYYKRYTDVFQSITYLRPDGIYETTTANVGNGLEYGWRLGGRLPIQKWWNLNYNLSLFEQEVLAVPEYNINTRTNFGYRYYLSNMFKLPKEFTLSTMLYVSSPTITAQTKEWRNIYYGLEVNKKIKSNLEIGLKAINPLSTVFKFEDQITYGNGFTKTSSQLADISNLFMFKLSYSFSKGQKVEKLKKPKGSDSNEGNGGFF